MSMNLKEALEKQEEGRNKKQEGRNKKQEGEQEQPKAAKKAAEKIKEEIENIDGETKETKETKTGLFNFKEENDFAARIAKLHFYGKNKLSKPTKDYLTNKPIKDINMKTSTEEEIGSYILNAFIQKAMEEIPFVLLGDEIELINSAIDLSANGLFKAISSDEDELIVKVNDNELMFIMV